jgi:predicted secreted protein
MKNLLLRTLPALLVAATIQAQIGGPPPPPPDVPHGFIRGMAPGPEMGMHKVVTGAPFSADITDQASQTLADGNTIQHTTTGHMARDSQGRTYIQHTINGGPLAQNGPTTITFISDPVAGYSYVLDPNTKTATRRALKSSRDTANSGPPAMPSGGRYAWHDAANRVESDLGTQNINGVNAQGKSITHTIPAGEMGNSKPIVSTSETWYSPDLQIPVLAKHSDPRSGQSTYALTNIQRGDPPASLFQIPSDYTVKDAPAHGPHHPPEE